MLIESQFATAEPFYEGLAVASLTPDRKGYIDHSGKFVIPGQYYEARRFVDDRAVVLVKISPNGDWYDYAFIDRTGKRNSTKVYSAPSDFKNGLARINKYNRSWRLQIPWIFSRGSTCYVDKSEKPIWCSSYHY
jgi:hypothetical protein